MWLSRGACNPGSGGVDSSLRRRFAAGSLQAGHAATLPTCHWVAAGVRGFSELPASRTPRATSSAPRLQGSDPQTRWRGQGPQRHGPVITHPPLRGLPPLPRGGVPGRPGGRLEQPRPVTDRCEALSAGASDLGDAPRASRSLAGGLLQLVGLALSLSDAGCPWTGQRQPVHLPGPAHSPARVSTQAACPCPRPPMTSPCPPSPGSGNPRHRRP